MSKIVEPQKYFVTKKQIKASRKEVDYTGWNSNIFYVDSTMSEVESGALDELWITIIEPSYVSKPCWNELHDACSDHSITQVLYGRDAFNDGEIIECHEFLFNDKDKAKKLAFRVQRSAKDKRKDEVREWREDMADGFHTYECLDRIFEIQQGRCYYSGEPLTKNPNNYSKDHIVSLCSGGSEWPENLALTLKHINTWKGGVKTKLDTLHWLSEERGKTWLKEQLIYCEEIDKLRAIYDQEFKSSNL